MSKLNVDEISDVDNTGPVTVTDGLTVQGALLASVITITGGSANWTAVASGTTLTFAYDGANIMRLDSSGNLTVIGNVTAYGVL